MKILFVLLILLFQSTFIHTQSYSVYGFGDSHLLFSLSVQQRYFGHVYNQPTPAITRTVSNGDKLMLYLQWMGPKTLHGINKIGFHSITNYELAQTMDALLFSFGEIDVRCHIEKQSLKQNRSIDDILEELTNNTMLNLINLRTALSPYKGPFLIFSILPPVENPTGDSACFPRHGTLETRVYITRQMNSLLRQKAALHNQYNIHILDLHALFTQENGTLKTEISDNLHHLHPHHNQPVIDELYTLLQKILSY